MSYADQVFRTNCLDILQNGVRDDDLTVRPHWEDGTPAHTIKKFRPCQPLRSAKGVSHPHAAPYVSQKAQWTSSSGSGRKKSNNVHDLSSHIWDAWADETGSIGKAYGYQLGVRHQYKEGHVRSGRPRAL